MLFDFKSLDRGFTLIEMMVVIAIIGMATIIILQDIVTTKAAETAKVQLEEVQSIIRAGLLLKDATTVALFPYAKFTPLYITSHKMVPGRYFDSLGTGISSAYGTPVLTAPSAEGFSINITGLEQGPCMDLVTAIDLDTIVFMSAGGGIVVNTGFTAKNLNVACPLALNDVLLSIKN